MEIWGQVNSVGKDWEIEKCGYGKWERILPDWEQRDKEIGEFKEFMS